MLVIPECLNIFEDDQLIITADKESAVLLQTTTNVFSQKGVVTPIPTIPCQLKGDAGGTHNGVKLTSNKGLKYI